MKPHIFFNKDLMRLELLDQRKLPASEEYCICESCADVILAIKNMTVRGAPAIGVTAAYGCVLALGEVISFSDWKNRLKGMLDELENARPTAVNLEWAVKRMRSLMDCEDPYVLRNLWIKAAEEIHAEDIDICKKIGRAGAGLLADGDTVLTHCNAGELATGGYGTALGVIRAAVEDGKKIAVIADETRPFLQGSRLTAWELVRDGIPASLICDSASGSIFQNKLAQIVIVGADRVALNGDTANKIGTLNLAITANYFHVPFYVACPLSSIDPEIASGMDIPIERRDKNEVTMFASAIVAPQGIDVINFAFDVTPAGLISGIITEKGILRPPYKEAIMRVMAGNGI